MRLLFKILLSVVICFVLLVTVITNRQVTAQQSPQLIDRAHEIMQMPDGRSKLDSIIAYTSSHRKDTASETLFTKGLIIARSKNYKDLEARILDGYGVLKRDFSDFSEALQLHRQALELAKSSNNKKIEMYALNNIGVVFRRLDQNNEALNYHVDALKIAEDIKDGFSMSVSLNSIGNIHSTLGNYDDAIRYFRKALPIASEANNFLGMAMNLGNIGECYDRQNQLDSAKKYYNLSLEYNRRLTNPEQREKGIAICYGSLGRLFMKKGDFEKAEQLFVEGLKINKTLGDKIFISQSYNFLGDVYQRQNEWKKAQGMFESALKIAKSIGSKSEMKEACQGLMKVYIGMGDYKKALNYSSLEKLYTDSLNQESSTRHVKQVEAIYQSESEQTKIKLLETTRYNDRVIMIGSLILFALLLISGILYYLKNRLIERNKGLQRELDIRSQIASDLHDDMGSTLSSIHIFSELLRKPGANSDVLLTKIEENAKDTLEALDDIIWLVKPSNDKFSNLSMHISQYAIPLFEGKNIEFDIQFPEAISELPLPMETRRNIFLIVKESINNLVKYSQCTKALIKAEYVGDDILFTVKDNGKGFDPEMPTNRSGVKNLRSRAKQINAHLTINSAAGNGTEITLLVKASELVAFN